jgi:hypothetical protein
MTPILLIDFPLHNPSIKMWVETSRDFLSFLKLIRRDQVPCKSSLGMFLCFPK